MSKRKLIGKSLVRRTTLANGKDAIILTGVFYPENFDISDLNDEIWAMRFTVDEGIIYDTNEHTMGVSPEDYLADDPLSKMDLNKINKTRI